MHGDFDERAATWDADPAKVERARVSADAIRQAVPLTPATRVLEYGAGTGLVAQFLSADVGPVTLADPSAGMRSVMTEKVASGVLPAGTRVWDLDLAADPVPDEAFDLIVTVMALHHIGPLDRVLEGFAALLSDDGHVCIIDLELEDGSFHSSEPDFDGHHGFARPALAGLLEAAGFTDVRFQPCHEMEKDGATYPLFLATCRRA